MKIILTPYPGASFKGKTPDGKEVDLSSVEIEPFFFTPTAVAPFADGFVKTATDRGTDAFRLTVSASKGTVSKTQNVGQVVPQIDAEDLDNAGAQPAEEDDE